MPACLQYPAKKRGSVSPWGGAKRERALDLFLQSSDHEGVAERRWRSTSRVTFHPSLKQGRHMWESGRAGLSAACARLVFVDRGGRKNSSRLAGRGRLPSQARARSFRSRRSRVCTPVGWFGCTKVAWSWFRTTLLQGRVDPGIYRRGPRERSRLPGNAKIVQG